MTDHKELVENFVNSERRYNEAKFERRQKMITKQDLMIASAEYRKAKRDLEKFIGRKID